MNRSERADMSQSVPAFGMPRIAAPRVWRGNVIPLVGGTMLLLLLILAVFPERFAPYDPTRLVARPLSAPSAEHPLGTNDIGQDLLSELIWGTRLSLFVGLTVAAMSVTTGTLVGIVSGYFGGWQSAVLMRLADLTLALPFLPLVILLSAYLGPSLRNVVLVLALVSWAGPARLIRSRVLSLLNEPFVEASRALGGGHLRVMTLHIWPAVRNLVLSQIVLVAGISILAEASLSFLGLGDTTAKSWGTMLYFARSSGAFLGRSWQWWVLPTGIMLALTVLSLVLISYGFERRSAGGPR
jgi:peptide/nickel transport system ATP-binding protein/peptide/nickel transport system permease protein